MLLAAAVLCAPAAADWSGDGHPDLLGIGSEGDLVLDKGDGKGGFLAGGAKPIASGWGGFDALLAPGDFDGDDRPDLLVRAADGVLSIVRGDGSGGFTTGTPQPIGAGWQIYSALIAPGDFDGDGLPDVLARQVDGVLLLFRGNGAGGFVAAPGLPIGVGWEQFTAVQPAGDFNGDGAPDLVALRGDGSLLLFRGNGAGGLLTGLGELLGSGWSAFTAIAAGADFSGDGLPDVLARRQDGVLLMYRGNGAGRWMTGAAEAIGGGDWSGRRLITLASLWTPPPPDARVRLTKRSGCIPAGGRVRVTATVRFRRGLSGASVRRVAFYSRGGPRLSDSRAPYTLRLPVKRPAGKPGRVYARLSWRLAGFADTRHETVSRRFVMCRA